LFTYSVLSFLIARVASDTPTVGLLSTLLIMQNTMSSFNSQPTSGDNLSSVNPIASTANENDIDSPDWFRSVIQSAVRLPELREFQVKNGLQVNKGIDVFLASRTGSGKSVFMFSGLIAAQARSESGIGLYIVPTKALAIQQVLFLVFCSNSVFLTICTRLTVHENLISVPWHSQKTQLVKILTCSRS
jgi:hypothetical protein